MDAGSWRRRAGQRLGSLLRRLASARRAAGTETVWAGVGISFLVVLVLGVIGFTRYQEAAGAVQPFSSRLYLALQLFVFESGSIAGPVPPELQVARFVAPIVSAYAFVRAVAAVFREQVARLRLMLATRHVVVAGSGRIGATLAQDLLRRGQRVVIIDADAANPELETIRAIGGLVVIGDARSPETLRRARVGKAAQLIALCGDDGANIDVVARARQLAGERHGPSLHCVAHVANPDLGQLLCLAELERYGEAPVRVDFVNVHAAAAQAVINAWSPSDLLEDATADVAVIGGGPTARHLLVTLARVWGLSTPRRDGRLRVLVAGMDDGSLAALRTRHPEVERFADLHSMSAVREVTGAVVNAAYVCPDDDDAAALAALELRTLLAGHPTEIIVGMESGSGLGSLLSGVASPPGGPSLRVVGLLDEICRPETLLAGTTERMAQALHATYLRAAASGTGSSEPTPRPWSELPESLRESNRDQAAHVAVKLAAVGMAIAPLTDWDAALQPFPEADVEVMSRAEHDRWMAERRSGGWTLGPRDVDHRTTPYLVPWDELTEEIRDTDRLFVRHLPSLLASIGLQAVRGASAAARPRDAPGQRDPAADPRLAPDQVT